MTKLPKLHGGLATHLRLVLWLALPVAALWSQESSGARGGRSHAHQKPRESERGLTETLFQCRLDQIQLPASYIEVSVYKLLLNDSSSDSSQVSPRNDYDLSERLYRKVDVDKLEAYDWTPNQPLKFFMAGFNPLQDPIDGIWMEGVAETLSSRTQANVIFIVWHIRGVLAESLVGFAPAYLKTMAHYQTILDKVEQVLERFVEHVEATRASEFGESPQARLDYYSQFEFYGHSLGAHILSQAVGKTKNWLDSRLANSIGDAASKGRVQFGRLTGLDPAYPCFLNDSMGISELNSKVLAATKELRIVHSNAGLAGVYSARSPVEVNLNGGTFQPNCTLANMLTCSHSRSTDILTYADDQCQLVAYKCTKFEQFKLGACQTCDETATHANSAGSEQSSPESNATGCFVLVNMPEQHVNPFEQELVKAAAARGLGRAGVGVATPTPTVLADEDIKRAKSSYHFVNTNPNYKEAGQTHCLQHYQARLLVMVERDQEANSPQPQPEPQSEAHGSEASGSEASAASVASVDTNSTGANSSRFLGGLFNLDRCAFEGIQVNLAQRASSESQARASWPGQLFSKQFWFREGRDSSANSNGWIKASLNAIIERKLYTSLVTFPGTARRFDSANIEGSSLRGWTECIAKLGTKARLMLDVAFMSNMEPSVRAFYSSKLCANVVGGSARIQFGKCTRTELDNYKQFANKLVNQIKFDGRYSPWQTSLLNNLFSWIVSDWDAFRSLHIEDDDDEHDVAGQDDSATSTPNRPRGHARMLQNYKRLRHKPNGNLHGHHHRHHSHSREAEPYSGR